ncbi:MAG: sulfatase family protein [Planctomycetota bacterium]|jgi:choline-sulfatase
MGKPNILWICSDQQRFDTLGCMGNSFVHTPVLDKLAADGVLFEQAYCQNPVCTPSRASFLTGRYPRTCRARQNGQSIPADERLVTRLLANEGYVCGLSGKLHLSACYPEVCKGTEPRIDDGYDEFHWSHHPGDEWPTNEYFHWLKEKGVKFHKQKFEGEEYVETSMPEEFHQTTWCAEKAINFIEACGKFDDRPWLFSVNFFDPHHPFDPPAEYLQRHLDMVDDIPLPNYVPGELDNKPPFQDSDGHGAYASKHAFDRDHISERTHRLIRAAYWAMCDLIDTQVGRMLEALERTGQLDNTIVIYTSDHGEMLGDHGIYLKGPYFYDPAVHVPLIVSMPSKITKGVRSTAMVELVDLAPTLMEAAGLEIYEGMQGRSLWPMLTGQADASHHRDDVYCESHNCVVKHRDPKAFTTMVRTETHKLAAVHGMDCGELYDLRFDPTETNNLWDSPDHAEVKIAMLKRLCDRMAFTIDPLPPRISSW